MTQTRILYEIHPHTLGGTERFLLRFLQSLNRRRYEPIVISQNNGLPLQSIRSLGVTTQVMPDYFKASNVPRIADFIRANRISLVQSNYYSSNLAMGANLAGVPHLWRLGGHVDVGSGVRTRHDRGWALDMIRLLSKAIICNSKYVRSQFVGLSGTPRITVIPNGIAVPKRLDRVRREGALAVGMVAHLTAQKRHIDFIRAAERVCKIREDVSFMIVGSEYADPQNRAYAARVKRWGRNLQERGRLTISEFVEFGNDVYSRFDCVVLPSIGESFSNAILESMAAGIPVIAARSGGHPELVVDRRTGLLVPPGDPEVLANAMLRMISDSKRRFEMGRAARTRARARFSLAKCALSYESLYAKLRQ